MSKSKPLSLILIYGENGSFQKWFYMEVFKTGLIWGRGVKKVALKMGMNL